MNEVPDLILIRHGQVDLAWKGICYGAMDVSLSENGVRQSLKLAELLCERWQPSNIYHSGLTRTNFLADAIARFSSVPVPVQADARLKERNFGTWQGLTWDEAYASDPENFHGLIEHPDSYRPPLGETTSEMQSRAVAWLNEWILSNASSERGPAIAVAHSGPIAAIAGHLLQLHARDWGPWTIRPLASVSVTNLIANNLNNDFKVKCCAFELLEAIGNSN